MDYSIAKVEPKEGQRENPEKAPEEIYGSVEETLILRLQKRIRIRKLA